MNIPNPAALKQKLDEKRANAIIPVIPRQGTKSSVIKVLKSSETPGSDRSVSSPKAKALGGSKKSDRSNSRTSLSKEKRPKSNSTQTSSTRKPSTSSQGKKRVASPEASETTENSPQKTLPKKPFVLKEHLTQRPLLEDGRLLALKKSLETSGGRKSTTGDRNRGAGSGRSASKQQNKKENN